MTFQPAAARGFSLLEILVVLAILTTLLGLGFFMSLDTYRGYLSRSEQSTLAHTLERARSLAMSNSNESPWGACFDASGHQYVLFSGAYVAGAASNTLLPAQKSITVSGLSCDSGGVVFTQLSGTTTPVTATVTQGAHTTTIAINYEGRINW